MTDGAPIRASSRCIACAPHPESNCRLRVAMEGWLYKRMRIRRIWRRSVPAAPYGRLATATVTGMLTRRRFFVCYEDRVEYYKGEKVRAQQPGHFMVETQCFLAGSCAAKCL